MAIRRRQTCSDLWKFPILSYTVFVSLQNGLIFFFFLLLRRFDPIPNHGLPWWSFAITLFGHAQLGSLPLDKWSARDTDLYLTTHNIHKRHPWPPTGIKPTISAGERPHIPVLRTVNIRTHHDVIRRLNVRTQREHFKMGVWCVAHLMCQYQACLPLFGTVRRTPPHTGCLFAIIWKHYGRKYRQMSAEIDLMVL